MQVNTIVMKSARITAVKITITNKSLRQGVMATNCERDTNGAMNSKMVIPRVRMEMLVRVAFVNDGRA